MIRIWLKEEYRTKGLHHSSNILYHRMSATAAGNRAGPNDSGPNDGNLHSCPNNSAPNCGQQDLGAQMTSQDTGPSSHPQQQFSTRPVFYVPAPPPPPFLPFQWPMPFPYNPFGVSGSKFFFCFCFFPHKKLFVKLVGMILS